tara:strand:+ start:263 stop:367 length:105 start_codon:yes stop_codon:yes gene_type:complete
MASVTHQWLEFTRSQMVLVMRYRRKDEQVTPAIL